MGLEKEGERAPQMFWVMMGLGEEGKELPPDVLGHARAGRGGRRAPQMSWVMLVTSVSTGDLDHEL